MANVKNNIRSLALEVIFSSHGISRSSLADRLSVSAVTAGKAASYLLEHGAVIQRTGKCDGDTRKTLLLYPNPNLHTFVFDPSVGKLYCVHIGGKPKLIADYGDSCRRDGASFSEAVKSAAGVISTYKCKKYCLGSFILASGSIPMPCPDAVEIRECHKILSACCEDGVLIIHISPCGISYSFGQALSADITDTFDEARRAYYHFAESNSVNDAAKATAKLIASMAAIFKPSSVILSQSVFDRTIFSELVTPLLPAKSMKAGLTFTDRDSIISYASGAAIRDYIVGI